MAATVSVERRDSPGGSHSFSSVFAMERDSHQRRSRSIRHSHNSPSSNVDTSNKSQDSQKQSNILSSPRASRQRLGATQEGMNEEGEGGASMQDWKYPRTQGSSMKRRNSQRSPSRPRSQQGSQLGDIREADVALESEARKAPRYSEQQTHRKSQSEELLADRKGENTNADKGDGTKLDEAGTLIKELAHSRTLSDEANRSARQSRGEEGTNYTWQSAQEREARNYSRDGEYREGNHPSSGSRLPLLNAGYKIMGAPNTKPNVQISSRGQNRTSSPSPRLPAFVNIGGGAVSQQRHDITANPTSPRHMSSAIAYTNVPPYPSPRTGPRMSNNPMQSPTPSQSSQSQGTLPGQSFMPPSLMSAHGGGFSGGGGTAAAAGGGGLTANMNKQQQPSFVSKLYSMLEDESIREMISWGPSGTVFSVANPAEFSKVVLPQWFKHSNWQSFVRQLNMYGFHKVNHTYQGTPEDEVQVWEFKHSSFRRGEIHLLNDIKRKSSRHKRHGSYGRSMGGAGGPEYDMLTGGAGGGGGRSPDSITPSPEIGMQYLGSSGAIRDAAAMPGPSSSRHHSRHHQSSHSVGGHGDYSGGYLSRNIPPSTSSNIPYGITSGEEVAGSRSEHAHTGAPYQQGYPQGSHRRNQHSGSMNMIHGGAFGRDDFASARMDDLSDRIDAIIRHASYMENQLRSLSDQLYQSQQNEISMGRHINHLESQLRSIEDQLHGRSGVMIPRRGLSPGSTIGTSTLHSGMPAVPTRDSSRSQASTAFPPKSPVGGHHSNYSSNYSRAGAPGNSVTHSSADAYQKLPPPPSITGSSTSEGRGGTNEGQWKE